MKKQHKLLKALISTIIALSMIFGVMSIALAEGTLPEITVERNAETNLVTMTGSGFTAAQEIGILVLSDGVAGPEAINTDNPIESIDYIDQVTADETGAISLNYTTRAEEGSATQTFKVFTTDAGYAEFQVDPISVQGNTISGKVTALANNDEITVDLINAEGAVVATTNPDIDGNFTFADVAAGTYSIKFTKVGYLKLTITNIVVVDMDIALLEKALLAGDQNADGAINAGDLGAVLAAWNAVQSSGEYRPEIDFNNDGAINAGDLGQILANWNKINVTEDFSQQ